MHVPIKNAYKPSKIVIPKIKEWSPWKLLLIEIVMIWGHGKKIYIFLVYLGIQFCTCNAFPRIEHINNHEKIS